MIKISRHASKRVNERASLPKSALGSDAERAWKYGLSQGEVSGRILKYMTGVFFRYRKSANTRIYNDLAYCFASDETLITVLPLPANLRSLCHKVLKEKRERLDAE